MLILCNGMMRAGSTLQYNWTRMLIQKTCSGEAHGFASTYPGHTSPLTDERFLTWMRDPTRHLVKIHEAHPLIAETVGDGSLQICYIYRDIRDVAASAKHVRTWRGPALTDRLDKAIGYYEELRSVRDREPSAVLWQRYEDVTADPHRAVRDIGRFLNVPADDEMVDEIVEETSIENAQRIAAQARDSLNDHLAKLRASDPPAAASLVAEMQRGNIAWTDPTTHLNYNHISRYEGASGTWRVVLADAEAREITERYSDWLASAGYEL